MSLSLKLFLPKNCSKMTLTQGGGVSLWISKNTNMQIMRKKYLI